MEKSNAKTQEKTSSIHKYHRQKLLETMDKVGLRNLSKIQQTEIMLFGVFPRGDVNPLAHTLLNRYGNFAGILDADVNDLKSVHGIGKTTATKIKAIRQIIDLYPLSKLDNNVSLKNNNQFLKIIDNLLRHQPVERLYIFAIGHNQKLLGQRYYSMSKVREVGITPLELFNFVASTNCTHVLFAHNHPDGSAAASDDDHNAIEYIKKLLENFQCEVLDSIVIGTEGIYSENKKGFLKSFNNEFVIDAN